MRRRVWLGGALALALLLPGPGPLGEAQAGAQAGPPPGLRLLMLEEPGCPWCRRWHAEIGGAYPLTAEGRAAPLLQAELHRPMPEGVRLARPARYPPTFVLIADGVEIGRIEGYPGADFFYGLLNQLLGQAGGIQNGRTTDHAS